MFVFNGAKIKMKTLGLHHGYTAKCSRVHGDNLYSVKIKGNVMKVVHFFYFRARNCNRCFVTICILIFGIKGDDRRSCTSRGRSCNIRTSILLLCYISGAAYAIRSFVQ